MSYALMLPFDSDEPEFVRGFEAGRLWARIQEDSTTWEQAIHAENAEMVMRMCEATERTFTAREIDDTWINVVIE